MCSSLHGDSDEDECDGVAKVGVVERDDAEHVCEEVEKEVMEHESNRCKVGSQVGESLGTPANSPEVPIQSEVASFLDSLTKHYEVDDAVGNCPGNVELQVVDDHGMPEEAIELLMLGNGAEHSLLRGKHLLRWNDVPSEGKSDHGWEAVNGKGSHAVDVMEYQLVSKCKEGDGKDAISKDKNRPKCLLIVRSEVNPVEHVVGGKVAEVRAEKDLLLWIIQQVVEVSNHQLGWQDNGDEAHEVSLGVEKKE